MSAWVDVARADELKPGSWRAVDVDDTQVVVFNVDGRYYALEDVCTHDGGPLAEGVLEGHVIECPRHGARFDVRTGAVLSPPAVSPVSKFEVKVTGDEIQVATS